MHFGTKKRPNRPQNSREEVIEVDLKIKIPSHIFNTSSNIVVSGEIQPQQNQFHYQLSLNQTHKDKKAIAQRLLSKKSQENREHHPYDERKADRQGRNQSGGRGSGGQQSANYREQRQRTRENQVRGNNRQQSPQPVQARQYPGSKKISFFSKYNQLDGIFTLGNQLYALRSLSCAGFMIINEYPCSTRDPSYIRFKVVLPKPQEDDCGVGITFKPMDLVKCKIKKNPVKRCMVYYFASQRLFVAGSQYSKSNKRYNSESSYKLIVNTNSRTFILAEDNGTLLLRDTIPQAFIQEELYFFLELKKGGKIQILQ